MKDKASKRGMGMAMGKIRPPGDLPSRQAPGVKVARPAVRFSRPATAMKPDAQAGKRGGIGGLVNQIGGAIGGGGGGGGGFNIDLPRIGGENGFDLGPISIGGGGGGGGGGAEQPAEPAGYGWGVYAAGAAVVAAILWAVLGRKGKK